VSSEGRRLNLLPLSELKVHYDEIRFHLLRLCPRIPAADDSGFSFLKDISTGGF
jgi:hypothetical protein